MHEVLSGGGQGKYDALAKRATCQPPGSEFGAWAGLLFETIPATRLDGAGWSPSWETRISTAACRRQPHAAFEPIKVNCGKFRPREGSGTDGWGQVVPQHLLDGLLWVSLSPVLPIPGRALLPSVALVAGGVCTPGTKRTEWQTLHHARKGRLSSWI